MAVTRYNKPIRTEVRSEFVPLPLQLMDASIERSQRQYDRNKAVTQAAKESMYGLHALSVDQQRKKDIMSEYDKKIETALDETGGDYGRLTAFSDMIAGEVKRDIQSGELGAINSNALSVQSELANLAKDKKANKLSKFGEAISMNRINNFQGTKELAEGGYSKVDFYRPALYLEMGKVSDDYAFKVVEKFLKTGQKFRSAKEVSSYVYSNLLNNPQAVENAREQVEATFPGASEKDKQVATKALLRNYADVAGKKRAFLQYFKPDLNPDGSGKRDELTGKKIFTFDATGAQVPGKFKYPESVAGMLAGIGTEDVASQLAKGLGARSAVYDRTPQSEKAKADEATQKVEEKLKLPYYRDLAKIAKVDRKPNETVTKYINRLRKGLDTVSKSSINTRYSNLYGDNDDKAFLDNYIDNSNVVNENVYDVSTGDKDDPKDMKKYLSRSKLDRNDDDYVEIKYNGEVTATNDPQPFGIGTKVFSIIDKEGNVTFKAVAPKEVNNPLFIADRMKYALKSGMTQFQNGTKDMTFISRGDGVVNTYTDEKYSGSYRVVNTPQGPKFISVK